MTSIRCKIISSGPISSPCPPWWLFLESVWRAQSLPVRSVLDVGCGTGQHALELARRGFNVTGVDRAPEMLDLARQKTGAEQVVWRQGDARTLELGEQFDSVVMLFAVLGYQLENSHLQSALQRVRHHLKPDGVFIADFWHGPAVLNLGTSERMRELETPRGRVLRFSDGRLDAARHVVEVGFKVWTLENDHVTSFSHEVHPVRFFFPQELAFHAQCAGLELQALQQFEAPGKAPDQTSWNVWGIFRAF